MSGIDAFSGVEGVISPNILPEGVVLPEKKDFVPQGKAVQNHVNDYFKLEYYFNDDLLEFVRPTILHPHLMTPANFRNVLHVMILLLEEKEKKFRERSKRIRKARQVLQDLDKNMSLLYHYIYSLYQA